MFAVGDELLKPEDENQGFYGFGTDVYIRQVIRQLLERLEPTRKYDVLKQAFSNGRAILIMTRTMISLGQPLGKYDPQENYSDEDRIVSAEQFQVLEQIVLSKIKLGAENGTLLKTPKIGVVLHIWQEISGEGSSRKWVEQVTQNDRDLLDFLRLFLQVTHSHSISDAVSRKHYRLDPKWLDQFADVTRIAERLRSFLEQKPSNEIDQIVIKQFLREYDIRQRGKDPTFFHDLDEE